MLLSTHHPKVCAMLRFSRLFLVVMALGLGFMPSGWAGGPSATQPIIDALHEQSDTDKVNTEAISSAIKEGTDAAVSAINQATAEKIKASQGEIGIVPNMDEQALRANSLSAFAASTITINDIMVTRTKQLNGVPVGNDPTNIEKLVNFSDTSPINAQQFSIYMRYFCDPESRSKTMTNSSFNVGNGGVLSCGDSNHTTAGSSRKKYGLNDSSPEAREVINLPINPARLFLEPRTYPTADLTLATYNTNPMSALYYPAIIQSIEFLTGVPPQPPNKADLETQPGQAAYLETQAANTRKSLASYVFALLAGERVQSMGKDAATLLADQLEKNMPDLATQNVAMNQRILALRGQAGVSLAEYMKIIMFEVPTSHGYIEAINRMSADQLAREKIKLEGLQLAVNYQRNHWMEILAALEATNAK